MGIGAPDPVWHWGAVNLSLVPLHRTQDVESRLAPPGSVFSQTKPSLQAVSAGRRQDTPSQGAGAFVTLENDKEEAGV